MNEKSSNPQGPKSPTIALKERIRLDGPAGLTVGRGRSIGALTLVPVFHEGPAADYIPYASIQGSGLLDISEVTGGGQVNTLVAENCADQAVLLLEGEMLEGMQQTRVLNVTILVPAKTTLNIPVSCVEAGRWNHDGVGASKHEFHMSPRARSRKTVTVNEHARAAGSYASNQGEVWASVEDELAAHQVAAPTRAQSEIGKVRGAEVRRDLDQLAPRPGQAGVVAVLGGTPLCLDLFDRPSTLETTLAGQPVRITAHAIQRFQLRVRGMSAQAAFGGMREFLKYGVVRTSPRSWTTARLDADGGLSTPTWTLTSAWSWSGTPSSPC